MFGNFAISSPLPKHVDAVGEEHVRGWEMDDPASTMDDPASTIICSALIVLKVHTITSHNTDYNCTQYADLNTQNDLLT